MACRASSAVDLVSHDVGEMTLDDFLADPEYFRDFSISVTRGEKSRHGSPCAPRRPCLGSAGRAAIRGSAPALIDAFDLAVIGQS